MPNTLTAVTPKLLAQGLMALREFSIMPQLVNRRYEATAGQRGSTIDVPIPSAIAVAAVSAGATPPATADMSPTSVPIALDQWYEAPFYLTDQDLLTAQEGTIPMQASEAIKALANHIDSYILGLYTDFYGFHGTETTGAFVTPFGDEKSTDATKMRTILNKQVCPQDDRRAVLDPDAEGAALNVRAFQDLSWNGSPQAILEGRLNRKLGFDWFMDQNIPTHTAGTAAGESDIQVDNGPGYPVGTKILNIDETAGTNTILVGDIVTFAGHAQTYVVTAAITLDAVGVNLEIEPGLQAAVVDDEAIDVKPSHSVNLAFHRDAIAFATRPLARHGSGLGVISESRVDPISGLALRLEITHEHKRLRFSFDALYGAATIRRELGARLAGLAG